jgi:hypothetical protein
MDTETQPQAQAQAQSQPLSQTSQQPASKGGVPLFAYITIMVAIILILAVTTSVPSFSNPKFLLVQNVINFCLILILCFFYGILTEQVPGDNVFKKYLHLILPTMLIVVIWLKGLIMYSANLQVACASPSIQAKIPYNFRLVVWNTSKAAIAIFVVYIFVSMFPSFQIPFYELFDSDHPIITYLAIATWVGCATFPAETSCYFNLSSNACIPSQKIVFTNLSDQISSTSASSASSSSSSSVNGN